MTHNSSTPIPVALVDVHQAAEKKETAANFNLLINQKRHIFGASDLATFFFLPPLPCFFDWGKFCVNEQKFVTV